MSSRSRGREPSMFWCDRPRWFLQAHHRCSGEPMGPVDERQRPGAAALRPACGAAHGGQRQVVSVSSLGSARALPLSGAIGVTKAALEALTPISRRRFGAARHPRERSVGGARRHAVGAAHPGFDQLDARSIPAVTLARLGTPGRHRPGRAVSLQLAFGLDRRSDARRGRRGQSFVVSVARYWLQKPERSAFRK